jgi:hypothetical protein
MLLTIAKTLGVRNAQREHYEGAISSCRRASKRASATRSAGSGRQATLSLQQALSQSGNKRPDFQAGSKLLSRGLRCSGA